MSGIKERKKKRARRKHLRQIQRLLCILVCLGVCVGVGFGIKTIAGKFMNEKKSSKSKEVAKVSTPKTDTSGVEVKSLVINTETQKDNADSSGPIELTISSMGDCTLGTDENFNASTSLNAYYNAQGADYFFKNVRSILEQDDLSIVNLEGTFTTETTRADKKFAFKADPQYVSILTGGSVEAANVANNHSKDYGEQSFKDTLSALDTAGIASFGYDEVELIEVKGVKVGLVGIYELAEHLKKEKQLKTNIAALKEAGAQLIIVNFHWGIEREYVPNNTQKTLAHLAVDEGADLVIGHHPHVLQGVEKYKDKYIAYSLGNFCFGGNSNPQDKDTMIFQQTFTIKDGKAETGDDVQMIPCSISSSGSKNNYQPTPLDGAEKERVLKKIQEYSDQI